MSWTSVAAIFGMHGGKPWKDWPSLLGPAGHGMGDPQRVQLSKPIVFALCISVSGQYFSQKLALVNCNTELLELMH